MMMWRPQETGQLWWASAKEQSSAPVFSIVQIQAETRDSLGEGPRFRFGVLLAGRSSTINAGSTSARRFPDDKLLRWAPRNDAHVLQIPTLHVHGTRDPGLKLHQHLFEEYCHPRTRRLVVWDGDHRVPLKRADVSVVAQQIRRLFQMTVLD
ncbi:Esterase citA [Metarhizium anisopliae]|nr:Esterase citA [Metarhizium anisopliae]KAF5136437.1 Esterase citA [Metarhizium anisopliae]